MGAPNWKNQTIWTGDNLDVMRGMNSESVEMIYLDPPFNSNHNYAAPIGSKAAGAAFKDTWGLSDIDEAWYELIKSQYPSLYALLTATREVNGKSMMAYLIYMMPRIMEMHRILKPGGSIFLHCDKHANHYLRLTLDAIFGKSNFINEVIWYYKNASRGKRRMANAHDTIFWYSKDQQWTFNREDILQPFDSGMTEWRYKKGGQAGRKAPKGKTPDDVIMLPSLNSMSKERTGYRTQKPRVLLEYLIMASTNQGDMVLDPFCGCATTCVAAGRLERKWVGIDLGSKTIDLVKERMRKEASLLNWKAVHRTDIPERTDLGPVPKYNNPENKERLYGKQNGNCNGCGTHFTRKENMEIDHIVPRSKGGTDVLTNLQLLCGHCNRLKGSGSQAALISKIRRLRE